MGQLYWQKENGETETIPLKKKLTTLGRSSQCDILIPDREVSGLHANLITFKEGFRLIDLDSTNGTFVNDCRIHEQTLHAGDVIRLGGQRLIFTEPDELEATTLTFVDRDYLKESHVLLDQIKTAPGSGELSEKLGKLDQHLVQAEAVHHRLRLLFELAEAVNSAKNRDTVLGLILKKAISATGLERGAVLLLDETDHLSVQVAEGLSRELSTALSRSVIDRTGESEAPLFFGFGEEHSELDAAESIVMHGIRCALCLPLKARSGAKLGVLYLDSRFTVPTTANLEMDFLSLFALFAATAIQTRLSAEREKRMSEALAATREREKYERELLTLEAENKRLVAQSKLARIDNVLGRSEPMLTLFGLVQKAAPTDLSVLLTGETGTGKSMVARTLHELSKRKEAAFVVIDCAALPSELLESELFGHEKGAFTGAIAQKKGRVESAEGGTLFLDEIGDMSLALQAKLLRFLQERTFERVGGTKPISLDVRVIAATNKDLKSLVSQKGFREDLYYRLSTLTLLVPPLRERGEDILLLANTFLDEIRLEHKLSVKGFSPEARNLLLRYAWPGNVRQLKNSVQRATLLAEDEFIQAGELALEGGVPEFSVTLRDAREEVDRKLIRLQLLAQKGNLSRVARVLDVDRHTLRELIRKYGFDNLKKAGSDDEQDV
ncbi:MAG: hypothetical protein A2293_08175 [Elusimicrobia bacterium RIFOXYB2_FULL_49_7]|nr:MAG: hypothetical protein A2293_08175 [Elusimicrobia bacterium RIFOXYB2_FULL_49_7]